MKTESEKCAEVFRDGPGKFTFYCGYCTEQFKMHNVALDHIETHFALKHENKTNLEPLSINIESTNHDNARPTISPIAFLNDLDFVCMEEVKIEPGIVQPKKIPLTKRKPKKYKPKMSKQQKDWAEWGRIHQRAMVECDLCGIKRQKRNIINHIHTHNEHKAFVCSICQKGFSGKFNLNNHLKFHLEGRKYFCHICPGRFKTASNLDAHILTHTGKKEFKCNICGRAFIQRSTLSVHMRIHTGEKPYHCELCEKSFSTSSSYYAHKRRHNNERNFKCNACDMTFTTKHCLLTHSMIHTGERPFTCNICAAAFTSKGILNQHLIIHTDAKPYKCRFCDLTFAQGQTRRLHERHVHNDICRHSKVSI